jgi:predicted Rossmann fold nucleotide-binding protein DprA/Smf involved in DNA uptake
MTPGLSANTKAILLLTAPLISGKQNEPFPLLTPGEYKKLASHLRELGREPSELISSDSSSLLHECDPVISRDRMKQLLGRAFLLGHVVEAWQSRSIWVVSGTDAEYPHVLTERLGEHAPALVYGCGERRVLETGGLAIVGSRDADPDAIEFTETTGRLAATSGKTVVSGGARGIDQAAMRGALNAGGTAVGVLADSLNRAVINRENREVLYKGNLTLISPYDPNAGFNVGNAMQRNKLIYALAEAALVVSTDLDKGGTWSGAKEQLDRFRFGPVFVRQVETASPGLDALHAKGAALWPNPRDEDEFTQIFLHETHERVTPQDSSRTLF